MWQALQDFPHLGETSALLSALFWAIAVILFRVSGRNVRPLSLNLFKCTLCILLFVPTILLLGDPLVPAYSLRHYALLLLSGIIGIGISDTLFFESLNRIGANLMAILLCSYSPSVIIMAAIFLSERMSPPQLIGVALIISAVLMISRENSKTSVSRKDLAIGIFLGLIAMFTMAGSVIIMKPVLDDSPVVWATMIRTLGALVAITAVILLHPQRRSLLAEIKVPQNWKAMVPASIIGSYLAFAAWMGGMKYAQVSVASALNQMSTVFIFLLGVIFLKERATPARLLALAIAIGGALLITFL
jgi:drug/metabolite transporter (DMT)-like permease